MKKFSGDLFVILQKINKFEILNTILKGVLYLKKV